MRKRARAELVRRLRWSTFAKEVPMTIKLNPAIFVSSFVLVTATGGLTRPIGEWEPETTSAKGALEKDKAKQADQEKGENGKPADPSKPDASKPGQQPGKCVDKLDFNPNCLPYEKWKAHAYDVCKQAGETLTQLEPSIDPDCDKGSSHSIHFRCCGADKPQDPPPDCHQETLGSDTSCKDAFTWKTYGIEQCKKVGRELTGYDLLKPCSEDGYRYVNITCCDPTPPPPPPRQCKSHKWWDATSCKHADVWNQYVQAECKSVGWEVNSFAVIDSCSNDGDHFRGVEFECCEPKK
jgi:hypothetical protein